MSDKQAKSVPDHSCFIADACDCRACLAVREIIGNQSLSTTDGVADIAPSAIQDRVECCTSVEIVDGTPQVLIYYNEAHTKGWKGPLWDGVGSSRTLESCASHKEQKLNPRLVGMIRDRCAAYVRTACRTKRHRTRRPFYVDDTADGSGEPAFSPSDLWGLHMDVVDAVSYLNNEERCLVEMRLIDRRPRHFVTLITGYSEKKIRLVEGRLKARLRKSLSAYAA